MPNITMVCADPQLQTAQQRCQQIGDMWLEWAEADHRELKFETSIAFQALLLETQVAFLNILEKR